MILNNLLDFTIKSSTGMIINNFLGCIIFGSIQSIEDLYQMQLLQHFWLLMLQHYLLQFFQVLEKQLLNLLYLKLSRQNLF